MNLRKLLILTSMSLAAVALAAPASASAESVFTHEGAPIEHSDPKVVTFSGPFARTITGTENGWHCENTTWDLALGATGTGTVDNFEAENCTTTPDNLVAHVTALGLPWTIHAKGHHTIEITDIHVNNKVTHPSTPHLVVAESTLTGDIDLTVPVGQTNDIQTVSLSGTGTTEHFGFPPVEASAIVSGHLERTTETQVGIATLNTG